MTYLIFARSDLNLGAVADNASKFFGCALERMGPASARARLATGEQASFEVVTRKPTRDDLHAVREAEARGNAAGMGVVAELCTWVWQVTFDESAGAPALYTALAALASVALGPVLPPDRSTLFAVRGARERAGYRS